MPRLFLLFFVLFFSGCGGSALVMDVSDSIYKPKTANTGNRKIASIRVVNQADYASTTMTIFTYSYMGIYPATPTKDTVESDIKKFFAETFILEPEADKSLLITISKADCFFVRSASTNVPFISLFTVWQNAEYIMNLRVLFEIEQNSKVISSYIFDEKITSEGQFATQDLVAESYRKLIAVYRNRFFGELETKFIDRYF